MTTTVTDTCLITRLADLYAEDEWSPDVQKIERAAHQTEATTLNGLLFQAVLMIDNLDGLASQPPSDRLRDVHQDIASASGGMMLNMIRTLTAMGARLPEHIMDHHGFAPDGTFLCRAAFQEPWCREDFYDLATLEVI